MDVEQEVDVLFPQDLREHRIVNVLRRNDRNPGVQDRSGHAGSSAASPIGREYARDAVADIAKHPKCARPGGLLCGQEDAQARHGETRLGQRYAEPLRGDDGRMLG